MKIENDTYIFFIADRNTEKGNLMIIEVTRDT